MTNMKRILQAEAKLWAGQAIDLDPSVGQDHRSMRAVHDSKQRTFHAVRKFWAAQNFLTAAFLMSPCLGDIANELRNE